MSEISIVTAFFDIGRGAWTPDKGLPHYLQRTNDTYFERFSHLAKLDNEMVIFTSKEFESKIKTLRGTKPTKIYTIEFDKLVNGELKRAIEDVQSNPEYISKINPTQIKNPEYWNADYVLVNLMKSYFVYQAIALDEIHNPLVAWLDFGYCRDESTLNDLTKWCYDFELDKIHMFNLKDYVPETYIEDIIANNDVHITGPCIVASPDLWKILGELVKHSVEELLAHNLIDDDQTILLTSYLMQPDIFKLHKVSNNDWFRVFKDYATVS
jgi:protein YibB